MTGLDTNILVSYFVEDHATQARIVTDLIEGGLSVTEPGFVCLATVVELVWVLENVYRTSRGEVVDALKRMLGADQLVVQNEAEVATAVVLYKDRKGSFADALIGALGLWAGCEETVTFDRKAGRLRGFRVL